MEIVVYFGRQLGYYRIELEIRLSRGANPMEQSDGWLSVGEVAKHTGATRSQVRGNWCVVWQLRGLAKKVFNDELKREQWRVHPSALQQIPTESATKILKAEIALKHHVDVPFGNSVERIVATVMNRNTRPVYKLTRGDESCSIEGNKITMSPDGTIVVE